MTERNFFGQQLRGGLAQIRIVSACQAENGLLWNHFKTVKNPDESSVDNPGFFVGEGFDEQVIVTGGFAEPGEGANGLATGVFIGRFGEFGDLVGGTRGGSQPEQMVWEKVV